MCRLYCKPATMAPRACESPQLLIASSRTHPRTHARTSQVSQDELGVPGRLLRIGDRNSAELWGKPLADKSFA